MTVEPRLDYFGVKACGCVTAWMSGDIATKAAVRKFERDMASTGRTVDVAPFVRQRLIDGSKCKHTPERARDLETENARLRAELEIFVEGDPYEQRLTEVEAALVDVGGWARCAELAAKTGSRSHEVSAKLKELRKRGRVQYHHDLRQWEVVP